jgi:hypothetical protein
MASSPGGSASTIGTYLVHQWAQIGGGATGAGNDQIFVQNGQTVTATYSIPVGKNASSVGPITINSGVSVTVPSASRWVILSGNYMSSVVISGDTSGAITLAAPAVAGTNTITLPALTGTAVIAGQNSAITAGTAVASTSGTSIDFTSMPSWVKRITVMFAGVSTNGSSLWQFQLGAGSVTTSGYLCYEFLQQNAGTATVTARTSGFVLNANNAAIVMYGSIVFQNISGNNWVASSTFTGTGAAASFWSSCGSIALSGTLDRVRITTVNGTDTFDAGSINILYE